MVKSTEVLGKVFGRSLFGYNKSEVNLYLENDVKKQLEDYEKIVKDFKENGYKEKATKYDDSEKAILKVLSEADAKAKEIIKQAEEEALHIKSKAGEECKAKIEKAQLDASKIVQNANEVALREKQQAKNFAKKLVDDATAEKERIVQDQLQLQLKVDAWKNTVEKHSKELLDTLSESKWSDVTDVVSVSPETKDGDVEVEEKVEAESSEIIKNDDVRLATSTGHIDVAAMIAKARASIAEEESKLKEGK